MSLPSKPPAPGRPSREAATALPGRILDAARDLLLTKGFERTTLNQIAVVAGVTKRTVYVKVGDKADILEAVVVGLLSEARDLLVDVGPAFPVRERLVRFGDSLLVLGLDWDVLRLYRLMIAEAAIFPDLAKLMQKQVVYGGQQSMADLLRDEIRLGRINLDDSDESARLLVGMILGEPQREALFGLQPWTPQRCRDWIVSATDLFLRQHTVSTTDG